MSAALEQRPRVRGRPKLFDERVSVHLDSVDCAYVEKLADRMHLSHSAAARLLIREAIRARKAKARNS